MGAQDKVERILASLEWGRLAPYLGADDAKVRDDATGQDDAPVPWSQTDTARRWYRDHRSALLTSLDRSRPRDASPDADGYSCLIALLVAFEDPSGAASRIKSPGTWWSEPRSHAMISAIIANRGREWTDAFFSALTHESFSDLEADRIGWIEHLAMPLIKAGLASMPDGPHWGLAWADGFARFAWIANWWARAAADSSMRGPTEPHPGLLIDRLREDPYLELNLVAAFSHPRALLRFEQFACEGWELGPALTTLVEEGRLDRGPLIDALLDALTRATPPGTQRGMAKALVALTLSPDDIADRMPLAQSLLATCHGSVTAALLPPMLDAADADDLVELASTILARKEKAQRTRLLRALTSKDVSTRWGADAVVAALSLAAEVPDEAFAAKARAALGGFGAAVDAPEPEAFTDLWGPPPLGPSLSAAGAVEPDAASMTAALSAWRTNLTDEAAYHDGITAAAVAWAAADLHGMGEFWAAQLGDSWWPAPDVLAVPARKESFTLKEHLESCRRRGATAHEGMTATELRHDAARRGIPELQKGQASETVVRLGEIPSLLSTPVHADGSIPLAVLVERLRGYTTPAGPLDLLTALCRLEPTTPADVRSLDGLTLPLWAPEAKPTGLLRRRPSPRDAVDLVRRWIAGGGLPPRVVTHVGPHERASSFPGRSETYTIASRVAVAPVEMPVPLAEFFGAPSSLARGFDPHAWHSYSSYSVSVATVVPRWADLLAAEVQTQLGQEARMPGHFLNALVGSPAPGPAVTHVLAARLGHKDEDMRLIAVDAALTLIGRGFWSVEDYTECCLHMLAEGELRLARVSHAWEQLVLAGGMQPLWPTVMTVVEAACAASKKPQGLAELLAFARRYAPSVPSSEPGAVIPPGVVTLAGARGTSKAAVEARAWVAAYQETVA